MGLLSTQVAASLERSSWIRKMFETGRELKEQFGEENVYDFSLGNPDLPPPPEVGQGLRRIADQSGRPFAFGYMPNNGYPQVREHLAARLSREQGVEVAAGDCILTCGAAGGLNALFRAVMEPGEEIACPAPYFVEYGFYAQNHGARLVPVPTEPLTFRLDLEAMARALNEKTRIVLINSPNNPSGQVYEEHELRALSKLLEDKSREFGRPIFLVSDEPYRFLTFEGVKVPSILPLYPYSVVVSSFSKNLSLAGERIGFVLLNPAMEERSEVMNGLVFTNRILGYVNAPAVGQLILDSAMQAEVDVSVYRERRRAMVTVLEEAGYTFTRPKGAFYVFPQAPGGDDVAFVQTLQQERILAVPGTGFGTPGYFRLTFCVDAKVIERSAPGFKRAMEKYDS